MNVSYLYTPALRIDSLSRHCSTLQANVVVIDLEDSTHLKRKAEARAKVAEFDFTPLLETGRVEVGLRINAISTYDGLHDLDLVRSLYSRTACPVKYVFLPRVNHAAEVRIYRTLFSGLPSVPKVYSFIETVDGVENADAIGAASDALCFGQADLVAGMYSPNESFVNYARARLCVAAAKHRIQAIDTNSFEITDVARFASECVTSKGYGFTGKAAIHPKQVPAINATFAVTDAALQRYESIIDGYAESDLGFFLRDQQVIAPPFVANARRMLEFYKIHEQVAV